MGHNSTLPHLRETSSQGNEIKDIEIGSEAPRQDRFLESMEIFSSNMNMMLSQEMDSLMTKMMHTPNNRAINTVISDRGIPKMHSIN